MKMKFSINQEEEMNKIIILYDECNILSELENIIEECDIVPHEFYSILNKYGIWNQNLREYCFESYEIAGKTIDEINGCLVTNKLVKQTKTRKKINLRIQ